MTRYKSFQEAIDDGLINDFGTVVFWGDPGNGKSSLMTMACVDFMRPENAKQRLACSEYLCEQLRSIGYLITPPSDHAVFVDTCAIYKGTNGEEINAYEFKLKDFGVPTNTFKPALICPYGVYAFDETQKELDSHKGDLPVHTSMAFEFARHVNVLVFLAMQRPMRLPKDIREIARFIEVVGSFSVYNRYGVLEKTIWRCNVIKKNRVLEQYLTDDDPSHIDDVVEFEFDGDIYDCYDSHYFLPMFFKGMESDGLVLHKCNKTEFSKEYFSHYFEMHSIEEGKNDKKETTDGRNGKTATRQSTTEDA